METYRQLCTLARAGANVVHLASFEWRRVLGMMHGLARESSLPLRAWSQSRGVLALSPEHAERVEDADARDPIALLQRIHDAGEAGLWLLEDMHPFLREEHHPVVRWIRELARMPASPRKLVVLATTSPGLPPDLRKEVPSLELELPSEDDLRRVLEEAAEETGVALREVSAALLDAARGLTVMEAALAFRRTAVLRRRLDASVAPLVAQEKERIIRQSEVLEFHPPDAAMSDVGGLERLKQWLERRGRAFGAGAKEFGLDPPRGVLLLGVQGCGKSLLAKAVAAQWQLPLLRLDLGRVFGGIVGQSEGNIRAALQVAQALAPCVLWVDEIEKGLAGVGSSDRSDGGTTARVVGTLLTWLQEKRDPVFVVATANRIDLLPPELLRKGRFDELFFVDLPTQAVRREILAIHLGKKRRRPEDFDLDGLAARAQGFSGAELEEAVREGLHEAFAAGCELRTAHLADAIDQTHPLSRTMWEEIEALRRWARVRARAASAEAPEPLTSSLAEGAPRLRQETARNPFVPGASS